MNRHEDEPRDDRPYDHPGRVLTGYRWRRRHLVDQGHHLRAETVIRIVEGDGTETAYTLELIRTPGNRGQGVLDLFAEWTDSNGRNYQVHMPGRVLAWAFTTRTRLNKRNAKDQGKRVAAGRREVRESGGSLRGVGRPS